jgi:glycosyltransferase involved in cell wall biosynthesis
MTSQDPVDRRVASDITFGREVQPSVSVVVPAYNEAELLVNSLTTLHEYLCTLDDTYRWSMLVIDDGSVDGTGDIADDFAASHARVEVLHHEQNGGLGCAVRSAFGHCTSEYIVTMDSDLSYSPDHIRPLLDTIVTTDASVVVAAPYRPDAHAIGVPPTRLVTSRTANRLLAMAAGGGLTTLTGLVRAYSGDFARSLDLQESGPTVNCEILYRARERGAAVVEIPAHLDWTVLRMQRQGRGSWKALVRTAASTLAIVGRFLLLRARRH